MTALTLFLVQTAMLTAGPGGTHATLSAALAAAAPGDTVVALPGTYAENITIDRPVVLLGRPGAVIDGRSRGTVIRVGAPDVTIRGFAIRSSGPVQNLEHSGILATRSPRIIIRDNSLDDVLFGIYLKQSDGAVIAGNTVRGKAGVPYARRGDGIRLWYTHGARVDSNTVSATRDLVIWFSNGARVHGNRVTDGRYGLHYMYSRDSEFSGNVLERNEVGAFLMYSANIRFTGNVFAGARGSAGRGIGFKDTDSVIARENVIVGNTAGLSLDNSPHAFGVVNLFADNVIAYNDVAVQMLPSVAGNRFMGNQVIGNLVPVRITGGGSAMGNEWRANEWSDYTGFDTDRDGIGDTPYVAERLADQLQARHEWLQFFALSPAVQVLDLITRVIPLLKPEPLLVDQAPRLSR